MIKERNVFKVMYVKNIEPIFIAANSFGSAASTASLISDEEILCIIKQQIVVNVKFD